MTTPTTISPSDSWIAYRRTAQNIKNRTQEIHDQSAAGTITFDVVERYFDLMRSAISDLNFYFSISGTEAYAAAQHAGYTMSVEHPNLVTQAQRTVNWILTNIPKDGNNYELSYTRDGAGNKVFRPFTSERAVGFRTELQGLLALFD